MSISTATQAQLIPLLPQSQTLTITLNGVLYNLNVFWRGTNYVLDIMDSNNNPIVLGIDVVTGCDLLGQLKHLNIPGYWVVLSQPDTSTIPQYGDLGITSFIYILQ